jgi:hypothetical protein
MPRIRPRKKAVNKKRNRRCPKCQKLLPLKKKRCPMCHLVQVH